MGIIMNTNKGTMHHPAYYVGPKYEHFLRKLVCLSRENWQNCTHFLPQLFRNFLRAASPWTLQDDPAVPKVKVENCRGCLITMIIIIIIIIRDDCYCGFRGNLELVSWRCVACIYDPLFIATAIVTCETFWETFYRFIYSCRKTNGKSLLVRNWFACKGLILLSFLGKINNFNGQNSPSLFASLGRTEMFQKEWIMTVSNFLSEFG